MKVRLTKIISIALIIMQVSALLASGFVSLMPGQGQPQDNGVSIQKINSFSSIIVIISSNLNEQISRLVELACLTTGLAKKESPVSRESGNTKKSASSDTEMLMPGSVTNIYRCSTANFGFDQLFVFKKSTMDFFMLLSCIFIAIIFIDRLKMSCYFYLLPRGTIDDVIMIAYARAKNPHWKNPMRVFYCPNSIKIMILKEMCHV